MPIRPSSEPPLCLDRLVAHHRQQDRRRARRRIMVAIGAAALVFLLAKASHARWKPQYAGSPYAAWFAAQHNSEGQWCCDKSDGHYFDGSYTLNRDGSVTIGQTVIPKAKVLTEPNPTNRAIWWYTTDIHGKRTTWCFAPGALT